ncbi:hypothetical protein I4U23_007840 [Adineta vaga]|nr:hypothetical protein I4U23_007840 [Adineta vaga]
MQIDDYFHSTDVYPYRPIKPIWMIFFMSWSFIFFFFVNKKTKSTYKTDWLKQNTLLSFIHSTICSILIIIAVIRAPEMFNDPLSHSNFFNYSLIAFSIGYFLWDFYDCLKNSVSSIVPILFHHIVVITFLSHVLLRTRNVGYALYALSLEINSVFLHARRLLRWYSSNFQQVKLLQFFIDVGNYITFIIFRFGIVFIALRTLFLQRNRFEPFIYLFTVLCVCAIGILNVVLFYRLLKNQVSPKTKSNEKKSMTDDDILMPSK